MNTHESYVSLKTAKMLKEAGFKWGCNYMYGLSVRHNGREIDEDEEYELKSQGKADEIEYVDGGQVYHMYFDNTESYNGYACPTLAVAQRWLREVKNISIEIERYETPHPLARELFNTVYEKNVGKTFAYRVNIVDSDEESIYDKAMFDTFEEALDKGIQECLTILLEAKQ